MSEVNFRLKKIRKLKSRCDCLLIFGNDPNFRYYTNSDVDGVFLYDFKNPRILTTKMFELQVKNGWVGADVIDIFRNNKKFIDIIMEKIHTIVGRKAIIGVNKQNFSANLYENIKRRFRIIDISNELEEARIVKTEYEIRCIKKSCNINKKIFEEVSKSLNLGVTETKIAGIIEKAARDYNSKAMAIVAFGRNASEPHHEPSLKRLIQGENVLIDIVCRYRGYYSDVTRTFNSRFDAILDNVFSGVVRMIKHGIAAKELDIRARMLLGKYAKYFTTSLGHGLGVAVHERPWISSQSMDVLKKNMIFTIEPGIYMRSHGIRKEDDYLVTNKGCKKLTNF